MSRAQFTLSATPDSPSTSMGWIKWLAASVGMGLRQGRRGRIPGRRADRIARIWVFPAKLAAAVRGVLISQVLFTGVESLGFICVIAVLAGASVVLQAQVWHYGLSTHIGPLLVTLVIRELARWWSISWSSPAVTMRYIELGQMTIHGEIRDLEIQGIDPGVYLALPRVLGLLTRISIVCLTIFFCAASLLSGWAFRVLLQQGTAGSVEFLNSITGGALGTADVVNMFAKSVLPALAIGITCCSDGFNVGPAATRRSQGGISRDQAFGRLGICHLGNCLPLTYL